MSSTAPTDLYNAYYYAHDCGRPYQRDEEWLSFFGSIADRIVEDIQPDTVLDAGCAMGFLVESLRDRDVSAFGVDISEYAVQKVRQDIEPYCWVGSVSDPFPQIYDLIVCQEVLEHMPPAEAVQAVANLCRHTDDILFSSTPFDYKEATHFNVRPMEDWAELFARHGFVRDVDFDASFMVPWAVRFRRKKGPLHRMIRDYERRFWLLSKENSELRGLSVEMQQQLAVCEQGATDLEELQELREFRMDLDWTTERIRQRRQRNWAGRLHDTFDKMKWVGILDKRLVRRLPSLARPLSQVFVAEDDNLSAVTILMESRTELPIYQLQVALSHVNMRGEPIVERSVRPRDMPAMGPLILRFLPVPKSAGQPYKLTLHVPEASPDDRCLPFLWGYLRPGRPGSELRWGERRLRGEMVLGASYGSAENPAGDRWKGPGWIPHSLFDPGALSDLVLTFLSASRLS